ISLPCVRAFTTTWGPGLPLSKVWIQSTPVVERRWGSMSGAWSSMGIAVMVPSMRVGFAGLRGGTMVMPTVMAVIVSMVMVVPMVVVVPMVMMRVAVRVTFARMGSAFGRIACDGLE